MASVLSCDEVVCIVLVNMCCVFFVGFGSVQLACCTSVSRYESTVPVLLFRSDGFVLVYHCLHDNGHLPKSCIVFL